MEIGRIEGTVVATHKVPGLAGVKLQLLQPLDAEGRPRGDLLVVASALPSGPGDRVAWVGGKEAALALPEHFVPVDAAVVEILDRVDVDPAWRDRALPRGEEAS